MNTRTSLVLSACALALALGLTLRTPSAIAQDGKPAAAAAATGGHCAFKLKNQWVGPLKACVEPATADQCKELGAKDENSEAAWSDGACPTASRVGTCKKPDSALHYYEGDAGGLEMGCGFQSGEWKAAAK